MLFVGPGLASDQEIFPSMSPSVHQSSSDMFSNWDQRQPSLEDVGSDTKEQKVSGMEAKVHTFLFSDRQDASFSKTHTNEQLSIVRHNFE
jgi:hypothetical protein